MKIEDYLKMEELDGVAEYRRHWQVGDRLHGAGTPKKGEPYILPTVNEDRQDANGDWYVEAVA